MLSYRRKKLPRTQQKESLLMKRTTMAGWFLMAICLTAKGMGKESI
jgi:hypothetical protein